MVQYNLVNPDYVVLMNYRTVFSWIGIILVIVFGTYGTYAFPNYWNTNIVHDLVGVTLVPNYDTEPNDDDDDDDENDTIEEVGTVTNNNNDVENNPTATSIMSSVKAPSSLHVQTNTSTTTTTRGDGSSNHPMSPFGPTIDVGCIADAICHVEDDDDVDDPYPENDLLALATTTITTGTKSTTTNTKVTVATILPPNPPPPTATSTRSSSMKVFNLVDYQRRQERKLQRQQDKVIYQRFEHKYHPKLFNNNQTSTNPSTSLQFDNNHEVGTVLLDTKTNDRWKILVFRLLAISGWILFGISYYIDPRYYKIRWYSYHTNNFVRFLFACTVATIIYLQYYNIPYYIVYRKYLHTKQYTYYYPWILPTVLMLLGIQLSTTLYPTILSSWYFIPPIAGFTLGTALTWIYWRNSPFGPSYEEFGYGGTGTVYHWGGIIVASSWFSIAVLMNTISAMPSSHTLYIPIYITHRITVALFGVMFIIITTWLSGYAQDEGRVVPPPPAAAVINTLYDPNAYKKFEGFAFRWASIYYHFGTVDIVKYVMVTSWSILASSVFINIYYISTIWQPITLAFTIILQGIITSMHYQYGIRACNIRFVYITTVAMIVVYGIISYVLYWNSGISACSLSIVAFVLIMVGHYILHVDRKRGYSWVHSQQLLRATNNNTINNNSTTGGSNIPFSISATPKDALLKTERNTRYNTYTIGPVIYTTGMLFFCMGIKYCTIKYMEKKKKKN